MIREYMSSTLPNGLTLLQRNPDCAADLRESSDDYGWLFTRSRNSDGTLTDWKALRQLSSVEIMQAEDQRDENIVLQGAPVRA